MALIGLLVSVRENGVEPRARGELAAGLLDLQREMQADPRLDQVRQQLTGLARQMMSDDS
ncbi:hypothetical protein BGK55_13315 [Xanthomonas citri pv. malvacearum]|uniref:hypothetical protein n=1 Tax=Xanthomonas TaxID=338 RepID=UPI00040E4374|nr:hypothetical protein [Xanthomonas citri]AOL20030.1 hypothetical protein BGK55_13315 [Xanthomonas citri pv. malvacearum]ASY89310.1 hypothetical protein CIW72_14040 [Xanthomonas citri pv. malvacearum]